MNAKPHSAARALEAADRCIRACVSAANEETGVFKNAWNASQEALNNEDLSLASRLFIERIVLFVLISMTDYRKEARSEAFEEVKRTQNAAREEIKRAVDAAIGERKELERLVVALCLCVAVGVGLLFTRWQFYVLFPLAFALYVLKFRLPIKSLAALSPFKRSSGKTE